MSLEHVLPCCHCLSPGAIVFTELPANFSFMSQFLDDREGREIRGSVSVRLVGDMSYCRDLHELFCSPSRLNLD